MNQHTHDPNAVESRLAFTHAHAMPAAKLALEWFQTSNAAPDTKADGSPVTIADRSIETHLRQCIESEFPNDAILGEEFPSKEGTSGYKWIIDPIDGTQSFVHGVPLFGTMIACFERDQPVIGAIAMPCLDELVIAAKGHPSLHIRPGFDDEPLTIRSSTELMHATVCATSPEYFRPTADWDFYLSVLDQSKIMRGWSDCYAFVLLLTGRADAVIETGVSVWDLAALPTLIEGAGGAWSDFKGAQSVESGNIICASQSIHQELLELRRSHGSP